MTTPWQDPDTRLTVAYGKVTHDGECCESCVQDMEIDAAYAPDTACCCVALHLFDTASRARAVANYLHMKETEK